MSSSHKLIRTQLMLDAEVLEILKPQIQVEGLSLAQFVRDLMAEKADITKKRRLRRNKKLLSVAGILNSSQDYPDGYNHKDIYI